MLTSFKNTITGLILLALRWRLELVRQQPEVTEQRSDDGNGGTRCSRHRRMPLGGIQVATGINRNGCGNSGRVHGHLYGGTRIRVSSRLHRGTAQCRSQPWLQVQFTLLAEKLSLALPSFELSQQLLRLS